MNRIEFEFGFYTVCSQGFLVSSEGDLEWPITWSTFWAENPPPTRFFALILSVSGKSLLMRTSISQDISQDISQATLPIVDAMASFAVPKGLSDCKKAMPSFSELVTVTKIGGRNLETFNQSDN